MMGLKDRYHVQPSPLNEEALQVRLQNEGKTDDPKLYTEILATEKAKALVDSGESGCYGLGSVDDSYRREDKTEQPSAITTFVIGSDTIVDLNGTILEKPSDVNTAVSMLNKLPVIWCKLL